MWSGLKCSAGSRAASLSWTMTLQFGNESRGKHFLTPEKNTNPTNVSHSGFVWTQFWWKVEGLVGIYEWGLARVFTGMYVCAYACVCTLLGKWACQYAAQASLWWQADDSAVIGLISLRTWGEIWRLPQGSGAYHLPAHWHAHAHTLVHGFGRVHIHTEMCVRLTFTAVSIDTRAHTQTHGQTHETRDMDKCSPGWYTHVCTYMHSVSSTLLQS